jgi:uncharacterized protein (DUF1330 family)
MKPQYAIMLAVVTGFGLGAAAVQGLHAQAKPPAYVVAEVDVTNQDAFVKEYVPLAVKALGEAAGYKAIARGGKAVSIEGEAPKRIVINTFANLDAAQAAYSSADYKAARMVGNKYAKFRIYAVEGLSQ